MGLALTMSAESLRDVALDQGVCIRPVMHEVYDTVTGATQLIPTPCGATRDSKCPPCAAKNRRLRMQQCREGWHLTEEPEHREPPTDAREELDEELEEEPEEEVVSRRSRSTRRR